MNTPLRLALLLAATLPVALSANSNNHHKNLEDSRRDHHSGNGFKTGSHDSFSGFSHKSAQAVDQPVSVPDTASTLLLLGTGLGALVVLRRNFFLQAQ